MNKLPLSALQRPPFSVARASRLRDLPAVGLEGDASGSAAVAAGIGETIADSWITTKLKAKFFDETLLKHSDIHVETNDHVVTLTGTVASSTAKTRAEAITSGPVGMTRGVNQLSREAAVAIVTMAPLTRILAADICR